MFIYKHFTGKKHALIASTIVQKISQDKNISKINKISYEEEEKEEPEWVRLAKEGIYVDGMD